MDVVSGLPGPFRPCRASTIGVRLMAVVSIIGSAGGFWRTSGTTARRATGLCLRMDLQSFEGRSGKAHCGASELGRHRCGGLLRGLPAWIPLLQLAPRTGLQTCPRVRDHSSHSCVHLEGTKTATPAHQCPRLGLIPLTARSTQVQHLTMAHRMGKCWWKDPDLVRQELHNFCTLHALDTGTLPSTAQLRTKPGGNRLIHAIHMHGGVANVSALLGIPTFSAARSKQASAHAHNAPGAGPVQPADADLNKTGSATPGAGVSTPTLTPHAHTHPPTRRAASAAGVAQPHGYYADSDKFREELIAFGQNQTNNPHWRVLPSPAQLRRSGRKVPLHPSPEAL
jgi:hypothetical protein